MCRSVAATPFAIDSGVTRQEGIVPKMMNRQPGKVGYGAGIFRVSKPRVPCNVVQNSDEKNFTSFRTARKTPGGSSTTAWGAFDRHVRGLPLVHGCQTCLYVVYTQRWGTV